MRVNPLGILVFLLGGALLIVGLTQPDNTLTIIGAAITGACVLASLLAKGAK